MPIFIQINDIDNVAVALHPAPAGTAFGGAAAVEEIPQGHKMALKDIAKGDMIMKYGLPIGHATKDIKAGQWVHTHNMMTNLKGEVEYTYDPAVPCVVPLKPKTFMGYRRKDGRAAIRNEIWIIPTVGCVNDVAKTLVRDNQDLVKGNIDGLYTFTHPFGCSQTGHDHAQTRRLLAALCRHPNAGAVLVLHLGCENPTHDQFVTELGDYDPDRVKFLTCQQVEDELEAGSALLKELAEYASQFKREEMPVSELVVGMKCGGSDGLSGITANPTVGRFSDLMTAMGGTTILTEVPEMFGAETILMNRCQDRETFDRTVSLINDFKEYFIRQGMPVYENPSPGNKAGGISTLEEKSLGCTQKCGKSIVRGVLKYGERLSVKGLNLLSAPGNDLVASTALGASGCQLVLFTTGRGTPFGSFVPTMKISTNTPLAEGKPGWIDFNAGVLAQGESMEEVSARFIDFVLAAASGQSVNNEKNGYREIAIFKSGVTL